MRRTLAGLALVYAAAWGCSLSPRADPSRFFVLSSIRETSARESAGTASALERVGVGPVTFPAYLTRSQMVTRLSDNQIRMSETDRWAEPLDAEFRRVLGENLAAVLPARAVVMFPWHRLAVPDASVRVDVSRFERDEAGRVELLARWSVTRGGATGPSRETTIVEPVAAGTTDAAVAAQSRAIAALARAIADEMRAGGP